MSYLPIGKDDGNHNVVGNPDIELREQDRWLPIANVARLMKNTLPQAAKVSKDAKECMQECVSEFISFITSEASDKCVREKRKTINGEDVLFSLHDLGFENYAEVLKIYLAKYREQQALRQERGDSRNAKKSKRPKLEDDVASDVVSDMASDEPQPHNYDSVSRESLAESYVSPAKELPSPYFGNYNGGAGELDQHSARHELNEHANIPLDKHSNSEYQYEEFIHGDNDDPKKDPSLIPEPSTEIDSLNREYY